MRLGVCYYPEHWPESQWASDAARMKALGLSLVRIGEFAWSRIEPSPGHYEWDWLDRAIDTLAGAGLEVCLGTPTATPPKWLIDAEPGILCCDAHGRPRHFGSRRHYSFSSQVYQAETRRICAALAGRYARHEAVTLWQTDNEYGCHDTVESNDPDARRAFQSWLAAKYGRIGHLNTAWGTVFWSQEYRSFDEIDPPLATVTEAHPAHRMDWRRFSSDQLIAYNRLQTETLRGAGVAAITHNVMGHFTQFDHFALGEQLDLTVWDSYPLGFLEQAWWDDATKKTYARTGHPDFAGFHHDLYRRVGAGRFGVMEQQPGPVNWGTYNPAPAAGMVALWTLEAFAHGAELVSYFRWRQVPFAQEQMHAGLNRPDNSAAEASGEIGLVQACLADLDTRPCTDTAQVAVLFDYAAQWMHQIQPHGRSFNPDELSLAFYTALRELGLNVDIVRRGDTFDAYDMVVVPSLPDLTAAELARLEDSGAQILFGPRTGSRTADFAIPGTCAPGPLQRVLPIRVDSVESLRPGVGSPAGAETVIHWREFISAAIACHRPDLFGPDLVWRQGRFTYLGAWLAPAALKVLICDVAGQAGLAPIDLPDGVRLRRRGDTIFAFNYGPDANALDQVATQLPHPALPGPADPDLARRVRIFRP